MASKITYDDKISLTTSALPRANKCTDDDLNEIKQVVNDNADELDENTTNIEELATNITDLENKFNFSLQEQVIGTWIDDKPIYRKVFEINMTASSTSVAVNVQNLNIKNIIHIEGISQTDPMASNYYWADIDKFRAYYNPVNYRLMVQCGSDFPARPFTAYVILEYTKTTD